MSFRKTWTPPAKLRDREPPAVIVKAERRGTYAHTETVARVKQPPPVRDESYRRWVASLPCFECRIHGYSQCAHPNTGKAKGKKLSDAACFPLCCDRPGIVGCHTRFDRYELVSRADMPEIRAPGAGVDPKAEGNCMTRDEAIALRRQQLYGEPVNALLLQQAIAVIQATALSSARKPYKYRLPTLKHDVKETANAILLFNLGLWLGRQRVA